MRFLRVEIAALLSLLLALSLYRFIPSYNSYSRKMLAFVHNAERVPSIENATEYTSAFHAPIETTKNISQMQTGAHSFSSAGGKEQENLRVEFFNTTYESVPRKGTPQETLVETNITSRLQLNSLEWLQGSRVSNIEIPDELIDIMMHPHRLLDLPNIAAVLGNTICYETGRFRSISNMWNASDPAQIYDWEFRLLYLAIHRQSHMAAFPEYQSRQECLQHGAKALPHGLKNFDFECPNAKFLVTVLSTMGMGATFRAGAMPSIFMALATGRIPLFVQSVKGNGLPKYLTEDFQLASCKRRDLQCFFLPTSPCVITVQDLQNATYLTNDEVWNLKKSGRLSKEHENVRVVVQQTNMVPLNPRQSIHDTFRQKIYAAIWDLLNDWRNNTSLVLPEQWEVLTAAAESFRRPYDDLGKTFRTWRATQFYLMRPNLEARLLIAKQVEGTVPGTLDRQNKQLFGLPIRGSDKCDAESTCLSFDTYMDLMLSKWEKHGDPKKRGTILLTSEDENVLPRRVPYAKNNSFPFDFLVNDNDVQPGNGLPRTYLDRADAIMISSLTAIKIQLQASVLVGNCCSNFHSMLFDFVRDGCGADPDIEFECLDRSEDERFRICCGWTSGPVCQRIRDNFKNSRMNATLSAH